MCVEFAFLKCADYFIQITLLMPDSRSKPTQLYIIRTPGKGKKKIKNYEKEVVPNQEYYSYSIIFMMANCAFPPL